MKLVFPGSQFGPIGIDADGRWIKAAQFRRVGRGRSLWATAVIARADADAEVGRGDAERIAALLERRGFAGRRVVLGLPRAAMLASNLELPPRDSGAPIEQIARLELARATRANAVAMEMALWMIPAPIRAAEGSHAMALGATHETTDPLIQGFAAAGLDVEAIDARVLASARACGPQMQTIGNMSVTIDVGWDALALGVFISGVLVFERAVTEAGLKDLYTSITQRAGVDVDAIDLALGCPGGVAAPETPAALTISSRIRGCLTEFLELAQVEVDRSVSYVQSRYPQNSLDATVLLGDGAGIPGLVQRLQERLDCRVRRVDPGEVAVIGEHLIENTTSVSGLSGGASLLTAMGLALHTGKSMEAAA